MKKLLSSICILLLVGCVNEKLGLADVNMVDVGKDFGNYFTLGVVPAPPIKTAPARVATATTSVATPTPTPTPAPMAALTGSKLRKSFQNVDANAGVDAINDGWNSIFYTSQTLDFTTATTTGTLLIRTASPNRPVSPWSPNCYSNYSFGASTVSISDNCADATWQVSNTFTASYRIQSEQALDGNYHNVLEIDRSGTSNYNTASNDYERFEICGGSVLASTVTFEANWNDTLAGVTLPVTNGTFGGGHISNQDGTLINCP